MHSHDIIDENHSDDKINKNNKTTDNKEQLDAINIDSSNKLEHIHDNQ